MNLSCRVALVAGVLVAGGVASARPIPRPAAPASEPGAEPALGPPPDPEGAGARRPAGVADHRRIVGILDIRVEGVSDDVRDSYLHGLEDQLDVKQYWLASRGRVKQLLARSTRWTEGCVVGACLAEARQQTGAELVLLIALTGAGTSFGHVITLVRTDTGRVLAQDADRCDVCTVSEAMAKATLATIGLLNNVPDKLPDEAAEQAAATAAAVGKVERELAAARQHTTRLGLVLTVVGLAAAATGLALYEAQSHPPLSTQLTAVGGGALALGGIAVLTF